MSKSNLTRRGLVASTAAMSALALPAMATAGPAMPDPIFAAIDAFRSSEKAFSDRCAYEDETEDELTLAPGDHRTIEMGEACGHSANHFGGPYRGPRLRRVVSRSIRNIPVRWRRRTRHFPAIARPMRAQPSEGGRH